MAGQAVHPSYTHPRQYTNPASGTDTQPINARHRAVVATPPPAATQAPPQRWFSRWGPTHVVGVLMSFAILMLSAGLFALATMFRPFLKVRLSRTVSSTPVQWLA